MFYKSNASLLNVNTNFLKKKKNRTDLKLLNDVTSSDKILQQTSKKHSSLTLPTLRVFNTL